MSAWKLALASLCVVGFLKELNFLGPFLDFYLEEFPYNLTAEQVEYEVHPIFVYSYVCVIFLVILVTDLIYYKPIISLGILSLVAHGTLITWGRGILVAQLAFFTRGFSATTNIAYYSYAFAIIDPEKYRYAAGFSRIALLSGTLFGGAIAQALVHILNTDYLILNYVTLGFMCFAFVLSLFIPTAVLSPFQQVIERELQSPEHGRFQNPISGSIQNIQGDITANVKRADNSALPRGTENHNVSIDSGSIPYSGPMFYDIDTSSLGFSYNDMMSESSDLSSLDRTQVIDQQTDGKETETIKEKFVMSVNSVKETFSNKPVVTLSVFWIILTFVDFELTNTIHPLLDVRYPERNAFEIDGALESVILMTAVILVLVTSFVRVNWTNGAFLMSAASLVVSFLLILMATLCIMWLDICLYAACRILYQVIITVVMYEVAGYVSGRRFAFVFGLNMLMCGVLELVLSGARAGDRDTEFPPFAQVWVYAGLTGVLGLSLLACSVYCVIVKRRSDSGIRDDLDTLVT